MKTSNRSLINNLSFRTYFVLIRQINNLSTMEISEIKQKLPILKVLSRYHLKPDQNHRLCCPFHPDKTPSFQVYPETGTWTCFSSNCSAGSGDQVDFIMRKEGITKHQAILKAQELMGETRDPGPGKTKPAPEKKTAPKLTPEQRTEILTEAFTHFVRSLNENLRKQLTTWNPASSIIKDSQSATMPEHFTRQKKLPRSKSSFIYRPGFLNLTSSEEIIAITQGLMAA